MFLDDKLLEICRNTKADTPELIQQLNVDICTECDKNWKSKLSEDCSYRDVKISMDRTFNLFDSFVKTALESKDDKLRILGEMFKKYNYKEQLLAHDYISEIYNH